MKTKLIIFKILTVILAASVIQQLMLGNVFIIGIILTVISAIVGWQPNKVDDK